MIPAVTIPTKKASKGSFKTRLSIIIDGNESAVNDIMNASAVPTPTPF